MKQTTETNAICHSLQDEGPGPTGVFEECASIERGKILTKEPGQIWGVSN